MIQDSPLPQTIQIELPEGVFSAEIQLPPGDEMRLADLARALLPLSDASSALAAQTASRAGACVACGAGCGACCRQLVTVSPAEAWMLLDLIESLPPPRRAAIESRCAAIEQHLKDTGLLDRLLRLDDPALGDAEHYALAEEYFRLQLPCPFLEAESCGIYPQRAAICREYLVQSPAEFCRDPFHHTVRHLPIRARVGEALGGLCAQQLKTEIERVPLALAPRWGRARQSDQARRWPAQTLLNRFLLHLEVVICA